MMLLLHTHQSAKISWRTPLHTASTIARSQSVLFHTSNSGTAQRGRRSAARCAPPRSGRPWAHGVCVVALLGRVMAQGWGFRVRGDRIVPHLEAGALGHGVLIVALLGRVAVAAPLALALPGALGHELLRRAQPLHFTRLAVRLALQLLRESGKRGSG